MLQGGIDSISEKEFRQLTGFIKEHYGINLGNEKKALVVSRLFSVLANNNFDSFSEYFNYIVSDTTGDAVVMLLNKITTNHTFFMREPEHFIYFRDKILPDLTPKLSDKDLRVWSAGCSTGEEPYTLAMIMDEYFGMEKGIWNKKVLATDISLNVLNTAKKCEYSDEQMSALPKNWKLGYFKKNSNDKYRLVDRIRNEVIYRKFNLMDEIFPFKKRFHVIFCRNVMIYFDKNTRQKLVDKFYEFIEPGGYFFIGHSESLNQIKTDFKYVAPAAYRKG